MVRLVTQAKECGPGEPYRPVDVNILFGADTVSLRGPWNRTDLIAIAPTAAQVGKGLYGYHLDFPGDALNPGCSYEQWERKIAAGTKPTVYAHVATDAARPGKLALQYWLFYVFNDWNNPHEGDWEMIQLNFDAATAEEALEQQPVEVGYSQHEGAEGASWGASKLELVDGTHPVVSVAAGSHANFYGQALYLGSSASEGVGCDDTRGPSDDVRPVVETIPSDPTEAHAQFPWIGFQGRWGELQRAFFNGPTGPNLKTPVDGADPVVRRLAQPELCDPGGRRARAPGRPTSSAGPSRAAPTSCGGSCTSRAPSSSRSRSSSCWRCSGSRARPGGRPHRSSLPAGGRGARSSPPPAGCTGGTSGCSSGSGSCSSRSRCSSPCSSR